MAIGAVIALVAALPQPDPRTVDSIESVLSTHLPEAGAWSAVFMDVDPTRADRLQVMYHWQSRAWSLTSGTGATGQGLDLRHHFLRGNPPGATPRFDAPIESHDPSPLLGADSPVDEYFPAVLTRAILESPEIVREAAIQEDGALRIVAAWPGGVRNQNLASIQNPPREATPFILDYDAQGRLIRHEFGTGNGRFVLDYAYDDRSPADFLVPATITKFSQNGGTTQRQLVSVRTLTGPDIATQFNPVAWRNASIEIARTVAEARAAAGPATPRTPTSPPIVPASATPVQPPVATWSGLRWPLIATGLVVLTIGVLAWWKRSR